mgnify:CR=1 FL=1
MSTTNKKTGVKKSLDYKNNETDECWYYSAKVKDHFFNPRNFLKDEPKPGEFDTEGEVGNFKCGDIFHMWLKIDKTGKKIEKLAWKTFGCGPAIASASMFSEMVLEHNGMKIENALKITPQDIIKRLGGVPSRKMHCFVMAHQAFKDAVNNYKSGNLTR